MKKNIIFLMAALLILGVGSAAHAFPFPYTDVRALGMGGAYVAGGSGISAVNYNPALLAKGGHLELVVPVATVRVDDHIGIQDKLDSIDALLGGQDLATWAAGASSADLAAMDNLIISLDQPGKNSVDAEVYGGAAVALKAFGLMVGVGYSDLIDASVITAMDTSNISTAADYLNNSSTLEFKGIDARQLVFSAAREFSGFTLGANLRQINGSSYFNTVSAFNNSGNIDLDTLKQSEHDYTATALDVGFLTSLTPLVDVGIVARDLVAPKAEFFDGSTYEPDTRYRAGVSINMALLHVVGDFDLSTTESFSGAKFREMAVGAELALPVLKLRGGFSKNMALDGAPEVLHLGVGFSLLAVKIDLGGAFDTDSRNMVAGASLRFKL
ncbi:MAG: hypothetical protein GXP52_05200 [Deltaproteobacteria bacterium]|nr:hypothetical protein [Deltaproteobacteria bacterium]